MLTIYTNDISGCSDVSFHNMIWSTAFMGGYGIAFHYWQWSNSSFRQENFPAMRTFFQDIDFESTSFTNPGNWDDNELFDFNHSEAHLEAFYIKDGHGDRAMGWLHNCSYWWGNIDQSCVDRNNFPLSLSGNNNDEYTSVPVSLGNYYVGKVELHHFNNLQEYTIDYYQTRNQGGVFNTIVKPANILGNLMVNWIDYDPAMGYISDEAFKAYRPGNYFRESNEITSDTLFCWQDSVEAHGNHQNDSLGNFHYHWSFGNGMESDSRDAIAIYPQPGKFLVKLIVSDGEGWCDTLQQYIVKPESCDSFAGTSREKKSFQLTSWNVFPVPASSYLNFQFDNSWLSSVHIELFGVNGECLISIWDDPKKNEPLPVGHLPNGIYIAKVSDESKSDYKKIIVIN